MAYRCRCCGYFSDELSCRTEIDGFDENDRAVEMRTFYCADCGSEDLDWEDDADDIFDDYDDPLDEYHGDWDCGCGEYDEPPDDWDNFDDEGECDDAD